MTIDSWAHSLLRKYGSTGHFRLLKQLRSDLRANPIVRTHPTTNRRTSSDTSARQTTRDSTREPSKPAISQTTKQSTKQPTKEIYRSPDPPLSIEMRPVEQIQDEVDKASTTFRERLDSIDMR